MKERKQTLRAKTTEKLQKKVQDAIKQGWMPEDQMLIDYKTGEIIQKMSKKV